MPNCFSLTRKSTGQVAILQDVDTEMRKHFKEPPDPDHWLWSWYNTIGLRLALGRTFTDIIQECHSNIIEYPEDMKYYIRKLEIAEYLNQHFVPEAWAEVGRT